MPETWNYGSTQTLDRRQNKALQCIFQFFATAAALVGKFGEVCNKVPPPFDFFLTTRTEEQLLRPPKEHAVDRLRHIALRKLALVRDPHTLLIPFLHVIGQLEDGRILLLFCHVKGFYFLGMFEKLLFQLGIGLCFEDEELTS